MLIEIETMTFLFGFVTGIVACLIAQVVILLVATFVLDKALGGDEDHYY